MTDPTSDTAADAYTSAGVVFFTPPEGQAELFRALLADSLEKTAAIAWLPADWVERCNALVARHPTDMVFRLASPGKPGEADWLDTDVKRAIWKDIVLAQSDILRPALKNLYQEAKENGEKLEANAEFWDKVYKIDEAIMNAPATVVNAVTEGAGRAIFGNLGKLFSSPYTVVLLLAIAAGAVVYFRRQQ